MHIMRKQIHLDRSDLLCSASITPDSLPTRLAHSLGRLEH